MVLRGLGQHYATRPCLDISKGQSLNFSTLFAAAADLTPPV